MHRRSTTTAGALGVAVLLTACVSPAAHRGQMPNTATYQQLGAQLQGELAADQAQLEALQNLLRLTLADGALFGAGGAELTESGKDTLSKAAPALKDIGGQRIVVKSFTDNMPLGADLPQRLAGNVELSKVRAGAVSAYLAAQGVNAALISSAGLGETHPVASNDTPHGRTKNRRVEIDIVEAPQ